MRKTFMSVDEKWFVRYLTDVRRSVKDCYIGVVLSDCLIILQGVQAERYEGREEVGEVWIVVRTNRHKI